MLDFSCPQELKPAFEERHVRPYELFFDMGGWRLSGYDIDRKAVFSFTLSRIKNVRVTDVRFSLPKEYESSKKNNDMYFGVYTGEKKQKYRIAFYNAAAKWVRERHWASDQKIRDIKNGIIIEFTCSQPWKVLQWLFSHGASAHPLAPVELVEEWRRQIKGLWKLFCAP